MNNMIKIFKNEEFGSLRILKDDNGRIMFCGKDVASALGYSNTKDAIKRHCRWGVKHDLPHPQSPSKTIKMIFIPEGDVYRLVAHSKLPRAAEFESWIFDKILPQINQTGGYVSNEEMFIENYLPFLDKPYRNLFRLQMMAINKLNERIRHDQPLVEFANQVANTDNLIDMNAMAKLARAENIPVGRNKLYGWLKSMRVLIRGQWSEKDLSADVCDGKGSAFRHKSAEKILREGGFAIMEIKSISLHDLRKMNDSEGLVLQGCGGDLQEWVDGINDMLTESGILQNDNRFEKAYSFKNGGLTCLLFPFEDVQLDVGKLAIWRLRTREDFGSTWLSDYIVNNLEECVSEQDEDLEMEMK